ncbi:hypothetical protein [Streptomyces flaveus]|uniref:hypothetical protein n=1 Tax=Streptomyces flaveus TaxID=66370 RepID=UPI00331CFAB2
MIRYVHFELRLAITALAALVVTVVVLLAVRGLSAWPDPWLWYGPPAVMAAVLVLWTPLRMSRLKGFSMVLEFEQAVPREDPRGVLPTDGGRLFRGPFRPFLHFALALVAIALIPSLFWDPYLVFGQLYLAVDWLCKGLVIAHWERRHGVLLWHGHDRNDPHKLSYTPVIRRPPTQTATDAPPA